MQEVSGDYSDSTNDTKQATVLSTIGVPWRFPAIYITYDDEHRRKTSDGIAHFNFASSKDNDFRKLLAIYDAGTADAQLDAWIESHRAGHPELIAELEDLLLNAMVVYGRRFLENYRTLIKFLKEECPEISHTKGSPVYNRNGEQRAWENIQIRRLPRSGK